jgi:Na+-transporting methylmalonyl-CoA/oxaloacetate decarboxylase gamma subunit
MAELGQGLVLMLAGMGIVYAFLGVLIFMTKVSCKGIARFDYIFPKDAPKKAPVKAAGDDANIALAIAVALKR